MLKPVSIDADDAENRYRFEPADDMTPDRLFDRSLGHDPARPGARLARAGIRPERPGRRLRPAQGRPTQGKGAVPAVELAAQLGTTEGAVHTAVHRLKKRYRAILQREIAATLDDPSEVDDEIRWLFEAIRS